MDKDTWSRSIVAMLGLDMIGDLPQRVGFEHADGATPAPAWIKRLVPRLKKDDRLPISRTSRQSERVRASPEGPQRAQRVEDCPQGS